MKKILSVFLAIVIMQLSCVCSFANGTSQSDCIVVDVHKVDGIDVPIKEVVGLPKDYWIDKEGEFNGRQFIIGEDNNLYEGFIAYSKNATDFTTIYFKDMDIIDKYDYIYVRNDVLIINGYFQVSMYCSNSSEDRDLYLQTNDFESWCVSEKSILGMPDEYTSYVGEYNGYLVAAAGDYLVDDNGKFALEYYISSDGANWQEKCTPFISGETLESYNQLCLEPWFEILVTKDGIIFYCESSSITDAPGITTNFSEYIFTKDFENYKTIDVSALGNCNGKLLGEDENNWKYYFDSFNYLMSTGYEAIPVFTRWQNEGFASKDTWEITYEKSKLDIYILNTNTMKFEPYFEQNDCKQFTGAFVAKDKSIISTLDENEKSYIFTKTGNNLKKYEWENLNSKTLRFIWLADENYNEEKSVDIIGLKDSNTLFFTADSFNIVYEIDLSYFAKNFIYENYFGERGLYISSETETNGELFRTRYYVGYDELIEYLHIKVGCIFGEWSVSKEGTVNEQSEEIRKCCHCEKFEKRIGLKNNGWFEENGKWAYYENGAKLTSQWKKDSKGWCYLDKNGYMATNKWIKDSKGWCYVGSNGYCVTNTWKKDSKGWCYLDANGRMATNKWIKDSQGWCYVGANGYCVTNKWVKDSKGWVYLDNNGRMVTNKWVKDSKGWCYVGADGYAVTNCWKKDSKGWCYLDENGSMTKNEWVKDGGKWYYLDGNGYMVTGTKVIGGKTYKFNSSGVWIS